MLFLINVFTGNLSRIAGKSLRDAEVVPLVLKE